MNSGKTTRVLIVDDQPEIRQLVRMTLDIGGYELFEATDGQQALHRVSTGRPDVVLLDVMMPGALDGFQVCERIKSDPELAHIPIVMLTARGQRTDLDKGTKCGCDCYLTKPFSPLQLIDTVCGLVGK